jgi:hypothetical protein
MQDSTMIELKHGEVVMNIKVDEQIGDLVSTSWVYSVQAQELKRPARTPLLHEVMMKRAARDRMIQFAIFEVQEGILYSTCSG